MRHLPLFFALVFVLAPDVAIADKPGGDGTPPGLAKKSGVPPGLAKKGGLPPGLAKKLGAAPPPRAINEFV